MAKSLIGEKERDYAFTYSGLLQGGFIANGALYDLNLLRAVALHSILKSLNGPLIQAFTYPSGLQVIENETAWCIDTLIESVELPHPCHS